MSSWLELITSIGKAVTNENVSTHPLFWNAALSAFATDTQVQGLGFAFVYVCYAHAL